jgi:parvulin-like peptidyl-prolyl isomerase
MQRILLMSRFVLAFFIVVLGGTALAQAPVASHDPKPAATATAAVSPSAVVARVNGVELTQADVDVKERSIFPYYRIHGGQVPASARDEIRSMAMQRLVLDELAYQEAQRRHMIVPEAKLQKGVRELRDSFHSEKTYREAIAKKYGSEAAFERSLRRSLLIRQLWDQEVTRKSVVTPAEVRAYYEKNRTRFVRPESASIQSISILIPKDATEEQTQDARKRAEAILPQARAAKSYEEFGILAEKVSEDPWRVMMGNHKWTHRGEVDPQFEPVFSMKPGETSGVIVSKQGFHILRVNDHQAEHPMTFAEVHDRLRNDLEKERREHLADALEKKLKGSAKITVM